MLPPHESLTKAKESLLHNLKGRNITEINGDLIPDDPSQIELGVAVDKADPEKGWTRLEVETGGSKQSRDGVSLQAADLRNGQAVAFRFRKPQQETEERGDIDIDIDVEDPGWDVVLPSLDDEDEDGS
ncbi:hypothetical protein PHISCL_09229 [Aspergillus sclerotialis]|uniref:Uncharacterized protein n=1 Tax=Aspergillus sclerotialis TaxID=2070753 RepID=A0A3A2Z888_9EURO|nr:hypothetical protein PHISCL_09229 [Aspergillus sclerotialis]